MTAPDLPPASAWEPLVDLALAEDLGRAGDLTSQAIVGPHVHAKGRLVARHAGVVAGLPVAACALRKVDRTVEFRPAVAEGARVEVGDVLAQIAGPARALLAGERTALNLLARLSGIATATRAQVDAVAGTPARIVDTRKTTPGLRALEKYAVRCGGGHNHRFGLDDAVLIKDNHLAVVGGVGEAVRRAREQVGHLVKVEVEITGIDQLEEAIAAGADVVMLDNFPVGELYRAVEQARGRVLLEASGGVTPRTVRAVAESGVDLISIGWLTHSAPALDIAFDFD